MVLRFNKDRLTILGFRGACNCIGFPPALSEFEACFALRFLDPRFAAAINQPTTLKPGSSRE